MVSLQTVFTYPFHHAKLQILLHGVTANSLYLSFSPCKATNLTTWCHCKQSLLILFTMQSYKSYYMVSLQTVFTYPFHHAKLQILLHGVCKQSLLILFTMQSYKSYKKQSLFQAKLQILQNISSGFLQYFTGSLVNKKGKLFLLLRAALSGMASFTNNALCVNP